MQTRQKLQEAISESSLTTFILCIKEQFGLQLDLYNPRSLRRRLAKTLEEFQLTRLQQLAALLAKDPLAYSKFIERFTVQVTELFREPHALLLLKEEVFSFLSKRSKINILLVGSSTGEELCSLTILLKEADIWDKSKITATDLSLTALEKAKRPSISRSQLPKVKDNYQILKGKRDLSQYYQSNATECFFNESLFSNVSYKCFDITSDELDEQFDLIICRNLLIYFQSKSQKQPIARLIRHLSPSGFLMLGEQESLSFQDHHSVKLQIVSREHKIYQQNPLFWQGG